MDPEVVTVIGVALLILIFTGILVAPALDIQGMAGARAFYEHYVDIAVVWVGALFALLAFIFAFALYIHTRSPKDAYILGAVFLLLFRSTLGMLDFFAGTKVWLLDSVARLIDLGIALLLLAAVRHE